MINLWTAAKVRLFLFSLWCKGEDWDVDMGGWDCGGCTSAPGTGMPTCPGGDDCHYLANGGREEDGLPQWERWQLEDEADIWLKKLLTFPDDRVC